MNNFSWKQNKKKSKPKKETEIK